MFVYSKIAANRHLLLQKIIGKMETIKRLRSNFSISRGAVIASEAKQSLSYQGDCGACSERSEESHLDHVRAGSSVLSTTSSEFASAPPRNR